MDLVVHAGSGGAAGAAVRGRLRKRLILSRPLTLGCRLAALPDEGETRPSPRTRGEGIPRLTRDFKLRNAV